MQQLDNIQTFSRRMHRRRNQGGTGGMCPPNFFIYCYINCSLLYVWFQTVPSPPQSKSLSYASDMHSTTLSEDEHAVNVQFEVSKWLRQVQVKQMPQALSQHFFSDAPTDQSPVHELVGGRVQQSRHKTNSLSSSCRLTSIDDEFKHLELVLGQTGAVMLKMETVPLISRCCLLRSF